MDLIVTRLPQAHSMHQKILDNCRLWEVSVASGAVDDIVAQLKKEVSLPSLDAATKALGGNIKDLPEKQKAAIAEAVDDACAWLSCNAAVLKTESKIIVSFFRAVAAISGEDQRQWQMAVEQAQLLSEASLKCRSALDQPSVAAAELNPEVATLSQTLRGCEGKLRLARCKNQQRQERLLLLMKDIRGGVEDARLVLQEGAQKLMGLYVQQLSAKTVTCQNLKLGDCPWFEIRRVLEASQTKPASYNCLVSLHCKVYNIVPILSYKEGCVGCLSWVVDSMLRVRD